MAKQKKSVRKGKKKRKPGVSTQKFKFYKVVEGKIEKLKRECPKCGAGIFMAEHKDRFHCGKCGFSEFKKTS